MPKTMLFMLLLVGLSYQQCRIGCQKCASNDVCLLCDIINNYILSSGTCSLSTQQNCRILTIGGNCAACNPGYYLDQTTFRCVVVATANIIPNCLYYSGTQTCSLCNSGRFISSGQCVAATTIVSDCNYYSENGKCSQCNTGFIFQHTLDVCVRIPNNLNCLTYTHVNCTTCSTGFIYNRNNHALLYSTDTGSYNLLRNLIEASTLWGGLSVCRQIEAKNCKLQNVFNECISCADGFYLKNKLCVAFPVNPIANCLIYSTATSCSSCVEFMYPINPSTCVNNTIIARCIRYSATASSNICLECENDYSLSANACLLRVNSLAIADCTERVIAEDKCKTCAAGTTLTTDGLSCKTSVLNCKEYVDSTKDTPNLICSMCNDGWYITLVVNNIVCVKGTVENCVIFNNGGSTTSHNVCLTCKEGFYLSNKLCLAHKSVNKCTTYSQTEANICTACDVGHFPFRITTTCVATTAIINCGIYFPNGLSCQKCLAGFYPSGNACLAIPSTFANCEIFDGVRCTKCNAEYMVNDVNFAGTCITLPDYLYPEDKAFCFDQFTKDKSTPVWNDLQSDTTDFFPLVCNSCATGTYPHLTLPNEAICVKDSQLTLYRGLQNPRDTNCKRYGLSYDKTNPYLICMECIANKFITNYQTLAHFSTPYNLWNLNGITCGDCAITNTADNTNMIIPDDLFGFVNICIPASTSKGYITNDALPLKGCTRAARINYTKFPTSISDGFMNKHFVCISTLINSTPVTSIANVKNVLALKSGNGVLQTSWGTFGTNIGYQTDSYNYRSGSNTVPFDILTTPSRYDYAHGYLTTDNGLFPSIFNYKGILLEVEVMAPTTGNGLISDTKIMKSYENCEIFFKINSNENENTAFMISNTFFNTLNAAESSTSYLICLRCAFGYSLGFSSFSAGAAANTKPPFPSCSSARSTNCASTVVYGGLTTFLNTVVSCHQCTTGRYPTLLIETDYAGSVATSSSRFRGWRTGFYGAGDTTTAALQNTFDCLLPAAGNDKITFSNDATSNTQTSLISSFNCGVLGQIIPLTNLRSASVVLGTEIPNVCLACAANFFPTYYALAKTGFNGIPGYNVVSCTASALCDTTVKTQFNSCGKCQADSGTNYYAFVDSSLSGCVLVHSPNCFIAQIKDDGSGLDNTNPPNLCGVCKAGFFMNIDRRCEAIKIPNMADAATFSIPLFSSYVWNKLRSSYTNKDLLSADATGKVSVSDFIRVHYLLSASGNPYGVSACKAGWIQAPASFWAANICVDSPYLRANVLTTAPASKFIANCVRYQNSNIDTQSFVFFYPRAGQVDPSNKLKCEICKSGFVVNSVQDTCVSSTLTNCLRLEGSVATTCEKCVSTHRLVAKVCVATVIANCQKYLATATTNQATDTCSTCNDGFVLADNLLSCTEGTIAFCAGYSDSLPRVCLTCKSGYALLITNTVRYCYPIPPTSNCDIWQNVAHNSGLTHATFSCARCVNTTGTAFGLRSWDHLPALILPSSCLPFQQITNCVSYNQGKLMIVLNDFKCTKCTTTHYLVTTTGLCAVRVNNSPNCETFTTAADTCQTCKSGFYLSADAFTCIQNPPGIAGCLTYSDANVCVVCMTGFYLNLDHRCIPSTIVPNCKVYSGNWTCSACNNGFFLKNVTDCVVPDATNCVEVETIKACRNCAVGFGLSTTNGVTSCISNAIINCAIATQVAPFTCLQCSGNFYPGPAGTCLSVTTVITNCLVYDSATTCKTCSKGSVLSVLKTTCDNVRYTTYIDGNCDASYLTAAPACAQCALGSYFAGEVCTVCPNNGQSFGCLNCDPNNPNTCFLCSSGFFMNKNFVCIRNTNLPDSPPTDTVPSPPTSSAKKAVAFTLGLGALFLEGL